MADLGTLRPGAANTTGLSNLIGNPSASATALSDDLDTSYDGDNTNSSHSYYYGRDVANVPSDFGTIATCYCNLRYAWESAPTSSSWTTLGARIMASDGTTVLAAATSGGAYQTIASPGTTATPTNSGAVQFTWVNTSADKTAWDGAILQYEYVRNKIKGGDSLGMRVYEGWITGTYAIAKTGATPVSPISISATATAQKVKYAKASANISVAATVEAEAYSLIKYATTPVTIIHLGERYTLEADPDASGLSLQSGNALNAYCIRFWTDDEDPGIGVSWADIAWVRDLDQLQAITTNASVSLSVVSPVSTVMYASGTDFNVPAIAANGDIIKITAVKAVYTAYLTGAFTTDLQMKLRGPSGTPIGTGRLDTLTGSSTIYEYVDDSGYAWTPGDFNTGSGAGVEFQATFTDASGSTTTYVTEAKLILTLEAIPSVYATTEVSPISIGASVSAEAFSDVTYVYGTTEVSPIAITASVVGNPVKGQPAVGTVVVTAPDITTNELLPRYATTEVSPIAITGTTGSVQGYTPPVAVGSVAVQAEVKSLNAYTFHPVDVIFGGLGGDPDWVSSIGGDNGEPFYDQDLSVYSYVELNPSQYAKKAGVEFVFPAPVSPLPVFAANGDILKVTGVTGRVLARENGVGYDQLSGLDMSMYLFGELPHEVYLGPDLTTDWVWYELVETEPERWKPGAVNDETYVRIDIDSYTTHTTGYNRIEVAEVYIVLNMEAMPSVYATTVVSPISIGATATAEKTVVASPETAQVVITAYVNAQIVKSATAVGTVVVTATAETSAVRGQPAVGTVVVAATAETASVRGQPAVGQVVVAATAEATAVRVPVAVGTLAITASTGFVQGYTAPIGVGQIAIASTVEANVVKTATAVGTVVVAATAEATENKAATAVGTVVVSATVEATENKAATAVGTVVVTATAQTSSVRGQPAVGQIVVSADVATASFKGRAAVGQIVVEALEAIGSKVGNVEAFGRVSVAASVETASFKVRAGSGAVTVLGSSTAVRIVPAEVPVAEIVVTALDAEGVLSKSARIAAQTAVTAVVAASKTLTTQAVGQVVVTATTGAQGYTPVVATAQIVVVSAVEAAATITALAAGAIEIAANVTTAAIRAREAVGVVVVEATVLASKSGLSIAVGQVAVEAVVVAYATAHAATYAEIVVSAQASAYSTSFASAFGQASISAAVRAQGYAPVSAFSQITVVSTAQAIRAKLGVASGQVAVVATVSASEADLARAIGQISVTAAVGALKIRVRSATGVVQILSAVQGSNPLGGAFPEISALILTATASAVKVRTLYNPLKLLNKPVSEAILVTASSSRITGSYTRNDLQVGEDD